MDDTMCILQHYRLNLPLIDYEKHKFVSRHRSIDRVITDVNNAVEKNIKFSREFIVKV